MKPANTRRSRRRRRSWWRAPLAPDPGGLGLREPLTRAFFGQILGRIDRLARFVGAAKSATYLREVSDDGTNPMSTEDACRHRYARRPGRLGGGDPSHGPG